jgi:hypothetical protein
MTSWSAGRSVSPRSIITSRNASNTGRPAGAVGTPQVAMADSRSGPVAKVTSCPASCRARASGTSGKA